MNNTLSENLERIKDAVDDIRDIVDCQEGTIENVVTKVTGSVKKKDAVKKDVNFYDVYGNRVYSYTLAELQNLTELPPIPELDRTTPLYWNSTLEELKENNNKMNVGPVYSTENDKTEIDIETDEAMDFYVCLEGQSGTVTVEYGDGTQSDTITLAGFNTLSYGQLHHYAPGKYTIKLSSLSRYRAKGYNSAGSQQAAEFYSYSNFISGDNDGTPIENRAYLKTIKRIRCGKWFEWGTAAFAWCSNLEYVTAMNTVNMPMQGCCFVGCENLKVVVMGKSVSLGNSNLFSYSRGLKHICFAIDSDSSNYRIDSFDYDTNLEDLYVPTNYGNCGSPKYCYALRDSVISDNTTSFGGHALCFALETITIPKSCTSIANYTINEYRPKGLRLVDCRRCTQVPSLTGNAFNALPDTCKIVVPDSLYNSFKSSWSTHSSKIVKASEYTE